MKGYVVGCGRTYDEGAFLHGKVRDVALRVCGVEGDWDVSQSGVSRRLIASCDEAGGHAE